MTTAQTTRVPLVPQTFCSDGRTITYNVGTGWPLMVTATTVNAILADRDRLRAALERALLELSAIEHGLLGPEHAVKRNGCASAALEARAALAQSEKSA